MRGPLPVGRVKASNPVPRVRVDGVFHRLLVVVDRSEAAAGARQLASDWACTFGAEAKFVTLEERPARAPDGAAPVVAGTGSARLTAEGHTLGARNRSLVAGIAAAAENFGADLIVLGCDHRRLTRHRLGASLRERLARATELPVIVAPEHPRRREDGHDHTEAGQTPGHRVGAGRLARV